MLGYFFMLHLNRYCFKEKPDIDYVGEKSFSGVAVLHRYLRFCFIFWNCTLPQDANKTILYDTLVFVWRLLFFFFLIIGLFFQIKYIKKK